MNIKKYFLLLATASLLSCCVQQTQCMDGFMHHDVYSGSSKLFEYLYNHKGTIALAAVGAYFLLTRFCKKPGQDNNHNSTKIAPSPSPATSTVIQLSKNYWQQALDDVKKKRRPKIKAPQQKLKEQTQSTPQPNAPAIRLSAEEANATWEKYYGNISSD